MRRLLFLALVLAPALFATEPKPMGFGDEVKLLRERERELAYREGMSADVAMVRIREILRIDGANVRWRALRNRLLFGYPDRLLAVVWLDLPEQTPVELVQALYPRVASVEVPQAVRLGLQRYLEAYRPAGFSSEYHSVAALHFGDCGSEAQKVDARRLLCRRRVRDETTLAGQAGPVSFFPGDAEWDAVPAACRQRLGESVSCVFPSLETVPELQAFECRSDADCVAIKNGCGLRSIVGDSPNAHSGHRCRCAQGVVVRGCFPAEKVDGSSRGTEN